MKILETKTENGILVEIFAEEGKILQYIETKEVIGAYICVPKKSDSKNYDEIIIE